MSAGSEQNMPKIRFDDGEVILAELSPSRKSLIFPVLELILATGVAWLLIGLVDAHLAMVATNAVGTVPSNLGTVPGLPGVDTSALPALWARRILLIIWVWIAWRRCLRHMLFRQRSRIILTDRRLITASGDWRSRVMEIPVDQVVEVNQHGGMLSVWTRGHHAPCELKDVPHAAKVAEMLSARIVPWTRSVY